MNRVVHISIPGSWGALLTMLTLVKIAFHNSLSSTVSNRSSDRLSENGRQADSDFFKVCNC